MQISLALGQCRRIPATLIESEILVHEKGAFTGATSRTAVICNKLVMGPSF